MQLHELQRTYIRRGTKRIGRGGKRGTYSGRGQKGQHARSGHRIRPAERDLYMRLPKLRGVKNKPLGQKPAVLNVSDLEKKFKGTEITKKLLLERGVIKYPGQSVKILGGGTITKALKVSGVSVSQSARKKIEGAGGKIL